MGRGGSGRGKGGQSRETRQSRRRGAGHKRSVEDDGWVEWSYQDADPHQHDEAEQTEAQTSRHCSASVDDSCGLLTQGQLRRKLAAQWRFFGRVLHWYAPEEHVRDWKRLRLGDHIFTYYVSTFSEQHGIVCSNVMDSQGSYGAGAKESPWVIHWSGSRLLRTSLPDFLKGGELHRVVYPHWICQCSVSSGSMAKPQVSNQHWLEPEADDIVAKKARDAYGSARGFVPNWCQAEDMEFCVRTKTGGRGSKWELHGQRAVASGVLPALGLRIKGDKSPTEVFGGAPPTSGASAGDSDKYVSPPPGYGPKPQPKNSAGHGPKPQPTNSAGHGPKPQPTNSAGHGPKPQPTSSAASAGISKRAASSSSAAEAPSSSTAVNEPGMFQASGTADNWSAPWGESSSSWWWNQDAQQGWSSEFHQTASSSTGTYATMPWSTTMGGATDYSRNSMEAQALQGTPFTTPAPATATEVPKTLGSTLSADAEEFVPTSWDGIFQ